MRHFNLYQFQQKVMPVLLGWGVGSSTTGFIWWRNKDPWRSGFGSQFALWGLVDTLIAAFGLRSAGRNAESLAGGTVTPTDHEMHTRQFEQIIWLNTFLDIVYIVGGSWLVRKYPNDPQRKGIGWGVITQGSFLFIWDTLLGIFLKWDKRER